MKTSDPDRTKASSVGAGGSLAWTLALTAALLGVVALPRRTVRSGSKASPRGSNDGSEPARMTSPSHSGRDADEVARSQADRGRQAKHPTEIPAKGWKDIALRTYRDVGENRVMLVSAGVTFFALLAIFPAVAALVSIYGLMADTSTINDQLASLQGIMPQGALDILGDQVKALDQKGNATLGLSLLVSIALSVWSANGGMKHVFDALNLVYNEREKRNFFVLNLVSLAFTAGALAFLILALVAVVALPVIFEFVGIGKDAWWLALLRWPALLFAVLGGLAVLYRYGPSRRAIATPPRHCLR